jgi:hypothetical protein
MLNLKYVEMHTQTSEVKYPCTYGYNNMSVLYSLAVMSVRNVECLHILIFLLFVIEFLYNIINNLYVLAWAVPFNMHCVHHCAHNLYCSMKVNTGL